MGIRSNKARADRLAGEVEAERRARREHLTRARDIFGRRLGSPAGLAVCLGAGAVAGIPGRQPESRRPQDRAEQGNGDDRAEKGFLQRMTDSPVGNIAIRLAAATLVRYMLTPSAHRDGAGAGADGGPGPEDTASAA